MRRDDHRSIRDGCACVSSRPIGQGQIAPIRQNPHRTHDFPLTKWWWQDMGTYYFFRLFFIYFSV